MMPIIVEDTSSFFFSDRQTRKSPVFRAGPEIAW